MFCCPFLAAGVDYNATTAEFMFEGAPQQACVQINITSDDLEELDESFLVLLNTTLTSQTVSLNPRFAFVTITEGESQWCFVHGVRNTGTQKTIVVCY